MSFSIHSVVVLLAVAVVASALAVVESKHDTRRLFQQIEQLRDQRDALNVDWSRLRLEQGALATHSRVERIARDQLGLIQPDARDILLIRLDQRISGASHE